MQLPLPTLPSTHPPMPHADNELEALPREVGGMASLVKLQVGRQMCAAWRECRAGASQATARTPACAAAPSSPLPRLRLTLSPQSAPPLRSAQASFNRLRSLPAELGSLPHLEMVRAASCLIQEVPAALGAAPKLAWMSLASNPACRQLAPRAPPVVELGELEMGPKLGARRWARASC